MDDFMQQKVRIYYSLKKDGEPRNYFSQMTGIGPAFGASREDSPEIQEVTNE